MLQAQLDHEGGDLTEKLTLAYAHSLMPYPTTWHVAAAYLAWCPCHGAEAMEQLLSQMPLTQVRLCLCAVPCRAVLCCAVLCCAVLCCDMLYCYDSVLYCAML